MILLDLAVVITTFNSADSIPQVLESLRDRADDDSPAEVVVVDNASRDGSADLAERSGVRVIRNERNLGLSRANNIGAREASSSSLLFVNPDITVLPGCLRTLDGFARDHGNACLLGPALYAPDEDGGEVLSSARTFPTPLDILIRRTPLGRLTFLSGRRLRNHLFPVGTDAPAVTDWLSGAALWVTPRGRERVGLMSERFFLYFEDVDWAWRAHEKGMEVWYVPEAAARHACGRESARGLGSALCHHLRSMVIFYAFHPAALTGSRPGKRKRRKETAPSQ